MKKEIEIKYSVATEDALRSLERSACQIFPNSKLTEAHQTNFFFDTKDLDVRRRGYGLRLRQENEEFVFTIKGPSQQKKGDTTATVTQRLEFECSLDKNRARLLLTGIDDPLAIVENLDVLDEQMRRTRSHLVAAIKTVCFGKKMTLLGSFKNLRTTLPVIVNGSEMKLEFDRIQFDEAPIQFEVELEIPSMEMLAVAETFLLDLFSSCSQVPTYEKSKSERFYAFLSHY